MAKTAEQACADAEVARVLGEDGMGELANTLLERFIVVDDPVAVGRALEAEARAELELARTRKHEQGTHLHTVRLTRAIACLAAAAALLPNVDYNKLDAHGWLLPRTFG